MKGKGTRRRVQSDMLNVRLPQPLKQEIERRSQAQGLRVSEAVRHVLQAWVSNGQDAEKTAPAPHLAR
jgi:Arc/MetJ-type ribon-helix-helix transcriptional regulator